MPGKPYMDKHTPSDAQRRRRKKKEDKQEEQKTTKPFMKKSETSKYGKKHDRLRKKGKTLDEKSMDLNVTDSKFDRLQKRSRAKLDKAREIREKVDESPITMKPYQAHHPNMMKPSYEMNHPNMMKPYKAKHANMMKPPYAMVHPIMKHMSHNK